MKQLVTLALCIVTVLPMSIYAANYHIIFKNASPLEASLIDFRGYKGNFWVDNRKNPDYIQTKTNTETELVLTHTRGKGEGSFAITRSDSNFGTKDCVITVEYKNNNSYYMPRFSETSPRDSLCRKLSITPIKKNAYRIILY